MPKTNNLVQHTINKLEIPVINQHRDLGVVVSNDLLWDSHFDYLASKTYKTIGLLRRTFGSADGWLGNSLTRSQLLYCPQLCLHVL